MTLYDLLEYTGEVTDAEPQVYISVSREFLPYLLGACERLLHDDEWQPFSVQDAATFQAQDAMYRLLGDEELTYMQYSQSFALARFAGKDVSANGIYWYQDTAMMNCGNWYTPTPVQYEDIIRWRVALAAGTYYLKMVAPRGTNLGICMFKIDGQLLDSGYNMDLYNSSTQKNYLFTVPVTIAQDGLHEIILRQGSKNPSSSGYMIAWTEIGLSWSGS